MVSIFGVGRSGDNETVAEPRGRNGRGNAFGSFRDGVHYLPEVVSGGVAEQLAVVEGKELPRRGEDAARGDCLGSERPRVVCLRPCVALGVVDLGVAAEISRAGCDVAADDVEFAVEDSARALVALGMHVRERLPPVVAEVVPRRGAEGVFVAVVASGDQYAAVEDTAREEGARGRHVRAASPLPGGEGENVDRAELIHGGWVPAPEHDEVSSHGDEPAEEWQASLVEAGNWREPLPRV